MAVAQKIAAFSRPSVIAAKESVNRAFEIPLSEGLRFERRIFHALFGTEDLKNAVASFLKDGPGKATYEGR